MTDTTTTPSAIEPLDRDAPIFVAGHRGLVGSAMLRRLEADGFTDVITRTRDELDLSDAAAVDAFLLEARPAAIVVAAAKVGGIMANSTYPVQFLGDNLAIATSVLGAAHRADVARVLYLGSSCIYPKLSQQPITEDQLLTGLLEPTNEAYAIAKIAGLSLVKAYRAQYGRRWISAMPTNLYGPGDNFDPQSSHVLPAMVRRFDEAARSGTAAVDLWGTGSPQREFLHVDDLADACLFLLDRYDDDSHINVGTGVDVSIAELAAKVAAATGYEGELAWDSSKPDGTPRKLLDVSRINALGWTASTTLDEGIASTVAWYREHAAQPVG